MTEKEKKEYWERRKAGIRGQGERLKPNLIPFSGQLKTSKEPTKKALIKNTKRARKVNA